jgi:putative oxidoreductase
MIDSRTAPYAALVLRLALGFLFLAHVGLKIFVFTPAGTAQFFGSLGLPPVLAYVVIVWELLGGLALIFGVWPRIAALALIGDGPFALKPAAALATAH